MKKPPSIDTLRYAQKLEDNGMSHEAANAMAQALNEELADRLLTRADVREEIRQELAPIHAKLDEFGQRFAAIDGKFGAMDAKSMPWTPSSRPRSTVSPRSSRWCSW